MKKICLFLVYGLLMYLIIELSPQNANSLTNFKSEYNISNSRSLPGQSDMADSESSNSSSGEGNITPENEDDDTLIFRNESGDYLYKGKDGKYYISARQRMFIEARDIAKNAIGIGVKKIEVKIDDKNNPYYEYIGSRTQKFSVGNEGDHTVYFRVVDRLNNVSMEMNRLVTVDDTPPQPTISYHAGSDASSYETKNIAYLPRGGNIMVSAVDGGSGPKNVSVSRNDEPYKTYNLGDSIAIEKDGLNIIKVRATDNVLNVSTEYIYNVFVDTHPPCVELSSQYALLDIGNEAKNIGNRSGADTEVPSEEISKNNRLDSLPGQEDKIEKSKSHSIMEDEDGWCLGKRPVGRYTNLDNTFYLRGYDKHSGLSMIDYRIDGGEWMPYSAMFNLQKSGPQKLEIRGTDFVGNKRISSFDIIVDDLAPKTKVIAENEKDEIIADSEGVQKKGSNVQRNNINVPNENQDFSDVGVEIGPRIEE